MKSKSDFNASDGADGGSGGRGGGVGPKYIRTLGSKSLSGFSSAASSQVPSITHSPNQGFADSASRIGIREKLQRSPSMADSTAADNASAHQASVADTADNANTGSSSSVNSMANGTGSGLVNGTYRVAQACDRCRAKKTRCDGKRPQCSQCAAVGFECKISDKLSRRAFPRGYTETLEERVRELEAENRRLVALCDIKEQQIHLVSKYSTKKRDRRTGSKGRDERMLQELSSANGGALRVSSTNLYLLNKTTDEPDEIPHGKAGARVDERKLEEYQDPRAANGRLIGDPVATNLNDPTSVSFEQNEAPGLPAVKALTSMSTREQSTQLATLVALSVPRSTEEILFIPQLLAKIRQVYGFTSKQCLYSVSLLSSLKTNLPEPQLMKWDSLDHLKFKNLWEIDDLQSFLVDTLKFDATNEGNPDSVSLAFNEIDELVQAFFDHWSIHIPILNKEEFFLYYDKFKHDTANQTSLSQNSTQNFAVRNKMISYKIFACILLTLCQMGLLIKVKNESLPPTSKYTKLMSYYNRAINLFYVNPYFSVLTTSLQGLQFLALSLFYFLNTGNVSAIYELRGRVVSMTQQLRLHRCPSAVLGGSGSTMNRREQGDRRVLFWGIYYLDVFSALQLGVPRLFKDFEIECALPVADNDDKKVSLAGQMIRLEGCVSQFSLAVIRFAKVLGNVLDSIFKRGMTESIIKEVALIHENALDNWRRGLPADLMFEIDVNGTINMDELNRLKQTNAAVENMNTMVLLILYFLAKAMIHLPVVATRRLESNEASSIDNANADQVDTRDTKEGSLETGMDSNLGDRSSSSYVLLQQATNTMLNVLESIKSVYLPLPINVARTKARFALLSSRGLLEFIRGGALFLDNKTLLLNIVKDIEEDRKLEIPGIISWHSLKLLDMTINLMLQPSNTKVDKLEKLLKRKLNYYNRLVGRPTVRSALVSQSHSKRKHDSESDDGNNDVVRSNSNLTPASSKDGRTPPEKKVKIEHDGTDINTLKNESNVHISADNPAGQQTQHRNPVSTQSAIAEAFQLDPVLNGNLLSDIDLTSFFSGSNSNSKVSRGDANESEVNLHTRKRGSLETNIHPVPTSGDQFSNDRLPSFNDSNANGSTSALDGLFRVPSNVDFLNDEYYFTGNSQSNLAQYAQQNTANTNEWSKQQNFSKASNPGISFSNASFNSLFGHMNNETKKNNNTSINITKAGLNNSNSSGFNFAVDASLGLAPLLAWTPDISRHTTSVPNHNNDSSDQMGMILDTIVHPEPCSRKNSEPVAFQDKKTSDGPPAGERSYTNVASLEQQDIPTLVSHSNRSRSNTLSEFVETNDEINEDKILTLCPRRRPRRRQMSYAQEQFQRKNSNPDEEHTTLSQSHNHQDLFDWQNSK